MRFKKVSEAAKELGLAQVTLRAWIAQRKIGVVRLGRAIRIPEEEIDRLVKLGTVPAKDRRNP